jgi:SAM-dependent methyltransferase
MAREVGSLAFGVDARGYHLARLSYPDALYDELFSRLPLRPTVLEIGAGTGLVTEALLARDSKCVIAVEPDPALVRFTRERLADHRLTMVTGAFPEAVVAGQFDLIACAAAFHWMEPEAALARVRELLAPGGIWAMWWHSYCNPGRGDPFADEVMPLLDGVPLPPSWTTKGHVGLDEALHRGMLEEAGFSSVEHRLYRCERELTTAQVISLYESYSFVRLLSPKRKARLLGDLAELVQKRFAGHAPNLVLTALYWAGIHQ